MYTYMGAMYFQNSKIGFLLNQMKVNISISGNIRNTNQISKNTSNQNLDIFLAQDILEENSTFEDINMDVIL